MSERVLKMAYQSLTRIKSAITDSNEGGTSDKDDQEDLITFGPEFTEPVMRLLQTLKSMLDRPTPKSILSFPGMTEDDLFQFNIKFTGLLKLKADYNVRVAATKQLGKNEHWSSEGLYRHLCVLKKLIPRNETVSRAWIESFFFRVSAMVPHGEQLVLNLEQRIPAASDKHFGGHVDYTAIRTSTSDAEKFLSRPSLSQVQDRDCTFFVSEAKSDTISLQDHVPRTVCEMYLRAKQLRRKTIIRGTVTDGRSWIFLVLKTNPNGDGAVYAQNLEPITLMITVAPLRRPEPSRTVCDVIAGVLSDWVGNSNEDIGDDDWFDAEWDFEQGGSMTPS